MKLNDMFSSLAATLSVKEVAAFIEADVKVFKQTLTSLLLNKADGREVGLVTAWGLMDGEKVRLSIFEEARVFSLPGRDALRCRLVKAEDWISGEGEDAKTFTHYKVFRLGGRLEGEAGNLFAELAKLASQQQERREATQVIGVEGLGTPFIEVVKMKDGSSFSRLVCKAVITTVTKEGLFEGEQVRLEVGEKADVETVGEVDLAKPGVCFHGVAYQTKGKVSDYDEQGRPNGLKLSVVRFLRGVAARTPVMAEKTYSKK